MQPSQHTPACSFHTAQPCEESDMLVERSQPSDVYIRAKAPCSQDGLPFFSPGVGVRLDHAAPFLGERFAESALPPQPLLFVAAPSSRASLTNKITAAALPPATRGNSTSNNKKTFLNLPKTAKSGIQILNPRFLFLSVYSSAAVGDMRSEVGAFAAKDAPALPSPPSSNCGKPRALARRWMSDKTPGGRIARGARGMTMS
jgi:hypothetical protein